MKTLISRITTLTRLWRTLSGLPAFDYSRLHILLYRFRFVLPAPLLLLAGAALLVPAPAGACGMNDAEGCVFNFQYGLYENSARLLWGLNRMLLVATYQLDAIRYWVVHSVFSGAYDAVVAMVDPLFAVLALLALTVLSLLLMLAPVFGMRPPMSFKLIFAILLFGPLLITMVGKGFGELEQTRVDVAAGFARIGHQLSAAISFGSTGDDLAPTAPYLYPSSLCPTFLERRSGGMIDSSSGYPTDSRVSRLDEQAAAFLVADTQDIHCPKRISGDDGVAGLPRAFDDPQPGASNGYVVKDPALIDRGERQMRIEAVIAGNTRLVYGLVLSGLGLLNAGLHLLFSCCLALLFLTLPISMVLGMFQRNLSWLSILLRRAIGILQASWMSSLIVGIISAGLAGAFATGNAISVVGFAAGGFLLTAYVMLGALGLFKQSLGAVNEVLGAASGLGGGAADLVGIGKTTAGAALGLGAAALSGGTSAAIGAGVATAKTAATGLQAYRATGGNSGYAFGSMLGRSDTLRKTGEQLHAAGMLNTQSVQALQAGRIARHQGSYRAAGLMARDAAGGARRPAGQPAPLVATTNLEPQAVPNSAGGSSAPAALGAASAAATSHALRANPDPHSPRRVITAPSRSATELQHLGAQQRPAATAAESAALMQAGYTLQRLPNGNTAYWHEPGPAAEIASPPPASASMSPERSVHQQ